jgi:hypothetical protein
MATDPAMISELFLAHASKDAEELHGLARALRLRGIVPWVDKDGGFGIADHSPSAAREAIREDCFGLLLYATQRVFTRPFIRDVEIDEAKRVRAKDPTFMLFAVPRRLSFKKLAELSVEHFGLDLSPYHTVAIPRGADVNSRLRRVAIDVLEKRLRRAGSSAAECLSLQFSTRELMPDAANDVLCFDARQALPAGGRGSGDILLALQDAKAKIAEVLGRPRLIVHGSKHLSSAFLFGRVFAPFEMDVRQTPSESWGTDSLPGQLPLLAVSLDEAGDGSALVVEVAARFKNLTPAVDAHIRGTGIRPRARLRISPVEPPLNLDETTCRTLALRTYEELERALALVRVETIHLFVAAPQAFMMMLARQFKGMPPTSVYDWSGTTYEIGYSDPGGVV